MKDDWLIQILEHLQKETGKAWEKYNGGSDDYDLDTYGEDYDAAYTKAKAAIIQRFRTEHAELEMYRRQHKQSLEDYHEFGKYPVDSPERMAAYISQLSLHNLKRGAEVLAEWWTRGKIEVLKQLPHSNNIVGLQTINDCISELDERVAVLEGLTGADSSKSGEAQDV